MEMPCLHLQTALVQALQKALRQGQDWPVSPQLARAVEVGRH